MKKLSKDNLSFFTGWPESQIGRHITFEITANEKELNIKNVSNSNLIEETSAGYNITVGGVKSTLIIKTKDNGCVICTPYAAHPLFMNLDDSGKLTVTDSYNIVALKTNRELNPQYSALRLIGEVPGLHLPFLNTRYLFPSFKYVFKNGKIKAETSLLKVDEVGASVSRAFDQADAIYKEYCESKDQVIASLTGGYDSRFYCTMLRRHLKKEQLNLFYVGDYEAHIAKDVAKTLDAKFTAFDVRDAVYSLRQQSLDFYGNDSFFECSNGLWREEGIYLFNATTAAGLSLLGSINDNVGYMGMCIESANKGSGYENIFNREKMLDRMYFERHPDLEKVRNECNLVNGNSQDLEEIYKEELTVLDDMDVRNDIKIDVNTYYFTTFPKSVLRNGVYAKSTRIHYPLMDERFFAAYLGAPAVEKENIGFYRFGFQKTDRKLLALPHQSMDALKAGLSVSAPGSYGRKMKHKLLVKMGLVKKFKAPKRHWKDDATRENLGGIAEQHYFDVFRGLGDHGLKWMYVYELYLFGEYLSFLERKHSKGLVK